MSVLTRIAHLKGRRDEVPNQELARALVEQRDSKGIREIARNLHNEERNIRSDCIKVLYEVGRLEPALAAPYVDDFLALIRSNHNRMVWGAMSALAAIAHLKAGEIHAQRESVRRAIESGSVITKDQGIKTLAIVASRRPEYRRNLLPGLFQHLRSCRSQDVPQHCEHILVAVHSGSRGAFVEVLSERLPALSAPRAARVRRVLKQASAIAAAKAPARRKAFVTRSS